MLPVAGADQVRDIQVLKTYGAAPYGAALKKLEQQIKEKQNSVNEKIGVKVQHELRMQGHGLTDLRNQIQVSRHHIYGTLLRIDNEWRKSNLSRLLGVPRSSRMRRTKKRANMSSM